MCLECVSRSSSCIQSFKWFYLFSYFAALFFFSRGIDPSSWSAAQREERKKAVYRTFGCSFYAEKNGNGSMSPWIASNVRFMWVNVAPCSLCHGCLNLWLPRNWCRVGTGGNWCWILSSCHSQPAKKYMSQLFSVVFLFSFSLNSLEKFWKDFRDVTVSSWYYAVSYKRSNGQKVQVFHPQ